MWNGDAALSHLRSHACAHSVGLCAEYVREAIQAGGLVIGRVPSAKDYGPSLLHAGFIGVTDSTPQAGDVAIIAPIDGHPHGHMCMYDGNGWVSDFRQLHGVYPGAAYRSVRPPVSYYRYRV